MGENSWSLSTFIRIGRGRGVKGGSLRSFRVNP
jgi:hypothetical protein